MSSTYQYAAAAATSHEAERRDRTTARDRRRGRPGLDSSDLPRGRHIATLLVLVVALSLCALASRPPHPEADRTTTIRVQAGQSLWSLAQSHPIAGLSTAQTAQLIADLNDLDASALSAGAKLQVPVPSTECLAAR